MLSNNKSSRTKGKYNLLDDEDNHRTLTPLNVNTILEANNNRVSNQFEFEEPIDGSLHDQELDDVACSLNNSIYS